MRNRSRRRRQQLYILWLTIGAAITAAILVTNTRIADRSVDTLTAQREESLRSRMDALDGAYGGLSQIASSTAAFSAAIGPDRTGQERMLRAMLDSTEGTAIYGIGVWYEPFAFAPDVELYGPYVHRSVDGRGEITLSYRWNTRAYYYPHRPWYRRIMNRGTDALASTSPYFDQDFLYITFGRTILRDGAVVGVATVDVLVSTLTEAFRALPVDPFDGLVLLGADDAILVMTTSAAGIAVSRRPDADGIVRYRGSEYVVVQARSRVTNWTLSAPVDVTVMRAEARARGVGVAALFAVMWLSAGALVGTRRQLAVQRHARELAMSENDRLREEIRRREQAEADLRFLAYHDAVTTLPLPAAAGTIVPDPPRAGVQTAALVVSVDNVRRLSSVVGAGFIDAALMRAGEILSEEVARVAAPPHTVYRGRGFAFVVQFPCDTVDEARAVADAIDARFRQPIELSGRTLRLRTRIGVACYGPEHTLQHGVEKAEVALGNIDGGTARVGVFRDADRHRVEHLVRLESAMSRPGFLDELVLAFQPIVRLSDLSIAGFEALVRWDSPLYGTIGPGSIIPLAEENGTILEIGRRVLRLAAQFATACAATGRPPVFVSVNVSPVQLLEYDVVESFARILEETGVRPGQVELEITETAIERNETDMLRIVQRFREAGLGVAIDDFGSGASAFARLHELEFDWLKTDRLLVSRVDTDERSRRLLRSVSALAAELETDTVVEGIETPSQAAFAAALGFPLGQGFLYSRPVPAAEAMRLLERGIRPIQEP